MANKLDPMDLKQIITLHLNGYKILQFAFTLYNQNIDFDYLEIWDEYDTLLLPQEY